MFDTMPSALSRLSLPALACALALLSPAHALEPFLVDTVDRALEYKTEDGVALHGVVSYPAEPFKAGEVVPLVVLVHGFGLDRDSVLPLSDALVSHGFATARFDLRGHGKSQVRNGNSIYVFPIVPYEEFPRSVGDVRGILGELRNREGIDGTRVVLAGVSEGALIAIEAAALDPDILATVMIDPAASALGFRPERALGVVDARPVMILSSSQPLSIARAEVLADYGLGDRTIVTLESFDARHRLVAPGSPGTMAVADWVRARFDAGSP